MENIKYSLMDSSLNIKGKKIAKVYSNGTVDTTEFVQRLVNHNPDRDYKTLLSVMDEITEEINRTIEQGETLRLPFVQSNFSMKGTFDAFLDSFDKERNKLEVNFIPSSAQRKATEMLLLEKVPYEEKSFYISDIFDGISGTQNEILSPAGPLTIQGQRVKVEGTLSEVGIYFINAVDETVVKAVAVGSNRPSEVNTVVPILTAGEWYVEIRTQHRDGGVGKKLHIARTSKSYTVAE